MSGLATFSRERNVHTSIDSPSDNSAGRKDRMGLLSMSLATSPVVRWILPARIRSPRHRDIVFVGTTSVQLREFFAHDGQLADASAKLDLGAQIYGAKVISPKIEMITTMDAIAEQEFDEERFLFKGRPCPNDHPPQMVVLVTADNELVYLYARNSSSNNHVAFVYAKTPLLHDVSMPGQYVRDIAIDIECKMLAIATFTSFSVFSLKDVDELKKSIDAWDPEKPQSFQPHHEHRMIQVDGEILKMDFLRPYEQEPSRAMLLLIVKTGARSLLLVYQWDTRQALDQISPVNVVVQWLQPEDCCPVSLIPSHRPGSFAIVTETTIVFYDDVQFPSARRVSVSFVKEPDDTNDQLWALWAKPVRHNGYNNEREDILLIREDGKIRLFNRRHNNGPGPAVNDYTPGGVSLGVDSAICMLSGPRLLGGDTLIVGGSMMDGGVFHFRARQTRSKLQSISNYSPVHDIAILDSAVTKARDSRARREFVTTGVNGKGNIHELRFGLEAQIGWTVPLGGSETVNRTWTLEHTSSRIMFVIASHLERTTAIILDLESQQLEDLNPVHYPGFQLDVRTLAAETLTSSDIGVQITPRCIVAGFESMSFDMKALENCVCADIDGAHRLFAIVCTIETGHHIQVGMIDTSGPQPSVMLSSSPYLSHEEPLCLALFHFAEKQYLSIGCFDGHVEIFSISIDGILHLECRTVSEEPGTSSVMSIAVLCHVGSSQALLLAGTRDGKLKTFELVHGKSSMSSNSSSNHIGCTLDRVYQLGMPTVTIVAEKRERVDDPACALVVCESRLDQIVYFANHPGLDYMLRSIWLSTRNEPSYPQPRLTAVQRIRNLRSIAGGQPSGFLMCATMDDMLFARVIDQEQIVPRRLAYEEHCTRLMVFSRVLNKLLVITNPSSSDGDIENGSDNPETHSILHVVDADGAYGGIGESSPQVLLGKDQHAKALLIWEPTDGKLHFDWLVVGLTDGTNSRLGYISLRKLLSDPKATTLRPLMKFTRKKIHALCAVDKSSLAVSVGCEIVILRIDLPSKRWHEDARYGLPSPALSVSAQASVLYVATQLHSIIVVRWLKAEKRFETILTDSVARNARMVLPFGKHGNHLLVATASGQGTSLFAYSLKKNSPKLAKTLFEAQLPIGVDHIAPIPSSWAGQQQQYAFRGITFDGTALVFQTLSSNEWKLLHFIEQLVQPDPIKPARRPITLLTGRMARQMHRAAREEKAKALDSSERMHVHGDVIKRLVDQGPQQLRNLLGLNMIKREDDGDNLDKMQLDNDTSSVPVPVAVARLEMVARPILGNDVDVNDLPAAVIAWCRKMLRATIF